MRITLELRCVNQTLHFESAMHVQSYRTYLNLRAKVLFFINFDHKFKWQIGPSLFQAMTFRPVVFLLLWQIAAPYNGDHKTFLRDQCEPDMICHELDVESFQDYAIEFLWLRGTLTHYEFVQSKNRKVTERLTEGDDWDTKQKGRTVCRHPIPGAENKMFVEFSSERAEVIKFYEEGKHLAVDSKGHKLFRIMSDFKNRQHIAVDDLKHSIIYNKWLFLNSTHAIELDRYMNFKESESYKLDATQYRLGRLGPDYWSYGMEPVTAIPYEDIPTEFVELITKNCFGNPKKYCAIDPRDGSIHYTPYPAVLRMGDFIMEQRWAEVLNDWVPVYRFHHIHMPENEVFYFSDVASLVLKLMHKGELQLSFRLFRIRGVMPQPKEGDKIFELMLQRTTTTPSPAQSNTSLTSTLKPLPPSVAKPINYSSINEMEEEPMPKFIEKGGYGQNSASYSAGNVVATLLAVFMITM